MHSAVVDPGFPRGGGPKPPGGDHQHTILPNVPKKPHEMERF